MKRLFNKDVPFITYIIHDKNMKNGRTVTVYKPTQEYYILFELIKFRRLPSTFPDIGITVISEWSEPSPSDVSMTQDVLMDIKKDLSDAEIEELGAQEAERKEFCPNCEAEVPCTHEAELYVCDICGEDFAKYIVSRNCNVSDVSTTRDVSTDVKTPPSIENTNPDYYKQELARRDEIIARLKKDGERLAASLNSTYKDGEFCCDGCGKWIKGDFVEWLTGTYDTGLLDAQHAPDCPITLHRALMNELGNLPR